jgi:hypothetical protein
MQLSEDVLGDHDITAERLLAGAAKGAVASALIGGGIGAGVVGAQAVTARVAPIVRAARERVKDFGSGLRGKAAKQAADWQVAMNPAIAPEHKPMLAEVNPLLETEAAVEARRKFIFDREAMRDKAIRDASRHGDELMDAERKVTELARGQLKRDYVRENINDSPDEAFDSVTKWFDDMQSEIDDMLADPTKYGDASFMKAIRRETLQDFDAEIRKAIDGDHITADLFIAADNAKRDLQKRLNIAANTLSRGGKTAQSAIKKQNTFRRLEAMQERLRTSLEDTKLYGDIADNQRLVNAAWSEQIGIGSEFNRRFTTQFGKSDEAYLKQWRMNPETVAAYFDQMDSARKGLHREAWQGKLDTTEELIAAIEKAYVTKADDVANVARARDALKKLRATTVEAEDSLAKANALRDMMAAEQSAGLLSAVGTLGGGIVGGLPGAVAGAALGGITRPVTAIRNKAIRENVARAVKEKLGIVKQLKGRSDQVDDDIGRSTKSWLKRMSEAAPYVRRTIPRAYVQASEPEPARRQRAERYAAATRARAAAPETLSRDIERAAGSLAVHAPKTYSVVAQRMATAQHHLAANLPPKRAANHLLAHLDKPTMTQSEADRVLRIADAIDDPLSVVARLESGNVSREEIDAIKAVYPGIFYDIQKRVMTGLVDGAINPSYQDRITLSLLFDVPADPSLTPESIALSQSVYSDQPSAPDQPMQPQQDYPKTPKRPIDVASSTRTQGDINEAGGRFA